MSNLVKIYLAVAKINIGTPTYAHATPTCCAHHTVTQSLTLMGVLESRKPNLAQIPPAVAKINIGTPTYAHSTPTCCAHHTITIT